MFKSISLNPFNTENNFLVPEVIQTSAMDCGPAALKSILEGFNISVDYGQLREICQTDVDGTSIDTIEEIANQLGLEAEQVLVPSDHVLLPETQSLPAIIVVYAAGGLPHFVVIWNQIGPFIQVMDPGRGRRWLTRKRFLDEFYIHAHPILASNWRAWAGTSGFCNPLQTRLQKLRAKEADIERLINNALTDTTWYSLAALDAATRLIDTLVQAKGLKAGTEAIQVLEHFYHLTLAESPNHSHIIPPPYWLVQSSQTFEDNQDNQDNTNDISQAKEQTLIMRGAVLVRILGLSSTPEAEYSETAPLETEDEEEDPLSPELIAALNAPPERPFWEIFHFLRADGLLTPAILGIALILAAGGTFIEVLLLRSLLNINQNPGLIWTQLGTMLAFFSFFLLLEFPILKTIFRIARHLEIHLRIAILEKLPKLGDRYFRSRLTSDIAQRVHELRQLRKLPPLAVQFFRLSFQIGFSSLGLIWLYPKGTPIIILTALWIVGSSIINQPILNEHDLRVRTHAGALSRFYLDALLGLIPIRNHNATESVRREHETLLVTWGKARNQLDQTIVIIQSIQLLINLSLTVWLIYSYSLNVGASGDILLFLYWSLNLPQLGRVLISIAQQYPIHRNLILRVLDPLKAPESFHLDAPPLDPPPTTPIEEEIKGIEITLEEVSVKASGQTILHNINLDIKAGEHVAIIGASGAGKSTLAGLLLGWHPPAQGRFLINGQKLSLENQQALLRKTAWVDQTVHLWNRTFLNNLEYGQTTNSDANQFNRAIVQANLSNILEKLPTGQQTLLGEGGGFLSGGEGQRMRLGRALFQEDVKLVILDEPFRGLEAEQRHILLKRIREQKKEATLVFISHALEEITNFERVIVIEDGQIVEDGNPKILDKQPTSHYKTLLTAYQNVSEAVWINTPWRKLWLNNQHLSEESNNKEK